MNLRFTRPLKSFFAAAIVLELALGIGECILLSKVPETAAYYGSYVLFLVLSVLLGGFLVYVVTWFITSAETKEMRLQKVRISELERGMDNLENVASRREEFIASFAHELKTPLTAIIGYADMLRSKDMTPKSRFTAAGYIFSEGKRLEALSLKLMDIIVAGRQEFELKRFEVGYFIRSIAAVTVPSLSEDGITLDMRWEPGVIEVEPDLFKTLLINLVDNARKASRRNSAIELFGKVEDDGYAIYVRDHGRGMPQEELSRITEPFYMIDKSRSRAQNGAGLGLALCQRIAELHATKLEYESEEGKGTTVRILVNGGAADAE
ncbi:MAG: HAMP domain-containing histidine kinase [Oscillospiraceae bacterium]|nr:HAMP domain-containing histidine kinase [Oscillospiraceae bacterium]MCD7767361.1 HAMP domain-containing histidine kinase [Oscillospiraceae bacterium]MCD8389896.1 HAMP domain-containing histidine kinase [Oscillospiraceae bacterium]